MLHLPNLDIIIRNIYIVFVMLLFKWQLEEINILSEKRSEKQTWFLAIVNVDMLTVRMLVQALAQKVDILLLDRSLMID